LLGANGFVCMHSVSLIRRARGAVSGIMDNATNWFVASRVAGIITSPITIALVGLRLSATMQGYFYTMYSVLNLIVFFELGLGGVLIYVIGHRAHELVWTADNEITGPPPAVNWLSGLFRKLVTWYGGMALAFTITVLPLGYFLLSSQKGLPQNTYLPPFILFAAAFAAGIFLDGFSALVEGTGRIGEVKRMQFFQGIAGAAAVIFGLAANFGLWAVAFGQCAALFVLARWVFGYRDSFRQLMRGSARAEPFNWRKEVLPLQWRLAVTWFSGYFINMCFVPVLFAFRGPLEAGQMGMVLRLSSALYVISIGLVTTKAAKLSALAASDRHAFSRTIRHNAIAAVAMSASGAIVFGVLVVALQHWWPSFTYRILPLGACMSVMGVAVAGAGLSSLQAYARAQKQDPFVWANMATAVCVIAMTLFTALKMDASAMAYGYLGVILLVSTPLHIYSLRFVRAVVPSIAEKSLEADVDEIPAQTAMQL
jgi:hypothetical protein